MKVQYSPEDNVLDIRCNNVFEATFTMDTVNSRDSLAALISAAAETLLNATKDFGSGMIE